MEENRLEEQCRHHECEHAHHQESAHDHNHGHVHNHEHEHSHEEQGISVTLHEGAVVGTVRFTISQSLNITLGDIKERLAEIAEEIEEKGGYIGHIKGILQESGRMCRISVVEAGSVDTEIMGRPDATDIECVLIVFNMDVSVTRKILERKFTEAV